MEPTSETTMFDETDDYSCLGNREELTEMMPSSTLARRTNEKKWIQDNIFKLEPAPDGTLKKLPTDAFGEVEFQDIGKKISKYVRVHHETSMSVIIELMRKIWKLKLPNMLISVTGGAKDFQMKPRLKEVFRRGLVKLAKSTGAWVTTAGTHTGVAKHVGEAIRDYGSQSLGQDKIITIGIAPWGCVENRDTLISKEGSGPVHYYSNECPNQSSTLDPNHSHFLLVDNGTQGNYRTEIEFYAKLEKEIAETKIPGDANVTIPAVVVMVEGGHGTLKTVHDSLDQEIPVIIVKGSGRAADIMTFGYRNAGSESISDQLKDDLKEKITKEFEDVETLLELVCTSLEKRHLITIFEMDSENSACDFDVAVLKAYMKIPANKENKLNSLHLMMKWKRIDVAKSEIFSDDIQWLTGELDELMILALQENQVDFVKIFLDYGVSLRSVLSRENLEKLYKPIKDERRKKINAIMNRESAEFKKDLCKFPDQELFLWSLLMNQREMAFLFWELLQERLPAALVADKILKEMRKLSEDFDEKKELLAHAALFEERAVGVLDVCYAVDEEQARKLLYMKRDNWGGTSCIAIAIDAKNKIFISQPACQSLLDNIWMGQLDKKTKVWKLPFLIFIPIFFWLITFKTKNVTQDQSDDSDKPKGNELRWYEKIYHFYTAPVNIFFANVVSYCTSLIIFSIFLLVKLNENISACEIYLYVWMVSITIEEIRQFLDIESNSAWGKLRAYSKNSWNMIDALNILLFIIGFSIRHTYDLEIARIILAINLFFLFVRILHIFSVHKEFGPKLLMIWRMVAKDLFCFMMILLVFLIAYGIASQAILYPNSQQLSFELIKAIFKKPYFQMYGELFLSEIEGDECIGNKRCPSESAKQVVPVMMAIYILLTNVLLLNLLIAMFSNTFKDIQDNTDLHWHFQRCDLLSEYYSRPVLAPPLIILYHIYLILRSICKKTCRKCITDEKAFNKKLPEDEEKYLLHWEDDMGDNYSINEEKLKNSCMEGKVSKTFDRTEEMMMKIEELQHLSSASKQVEKRREEMMSNVTSGMREIEKQIGEVKQILLKLKCSDKNTE